MKNSSKIARVIFFGNIPPSGVLSMSPPLAPGETTYFGGGADGKSMEGVAKIVLIMTEVGFTNN